MKRMIKLCFAVIAVQLLAIICLLCVSCGTKSPEFKYAAVTMNDRTVIYEITDYYVYSNGTFRLFLKNGTVIVTHSVNVHLIAAESISEVDKLYTGGNAILDKIE